MNVFEEKYSHDSSAQVRNKWHDLYKFDAQEALVSERDKLYVIDTPPPTVSGNLHMGHLLSYSHIDFIARYQRMRGKNVFFPIGFDDNGLPTMKLLEDSGIDTWDIEQLPAMESLREKYHDDFRNLFDDLGMSYDWDLAYSTSQPNCVEMARLAFQNLWSSGLAYPDLMPVIWDTKQCTAIAQSEVVDMEVESAMHTIEFQGMDDDTKYPIATTRPEMLLACVAVLYNPKDSRWAGKLPTRMHVPLFSKERHVPVIADEEVKIDKGTGLVMLCTFGDEQDVTWFNRHLAKLDQKQIGRSQDALCYPSTILAIDSSGCMFCSDYRFLSNNNGREQSSWPNVDEARKAILDMLRDTNSLQYSKPIKHVVKISERSGAKIEFLQSLQLYVQLPRRNGAVAEDCSIYANDLRWLPAHMRLKYEQWAESIKYDWCITRDRHYGTTIPYAELYKNHIKGGFYCFLPLTHDRGDLYYEEPFLGSLAELRGPDELGNYPYLLRALSNITIRDLSHHRMMYISFLDNEREEVSDMDRVILCSRDEFGFRNYKKQWRKKRGKSQFPGKRSGNYDYCQDDVPTFKYPRIDTWFTSSLTPQINAGALKGEKGFLIPETRPSFVHLTPEQRITMFHQLFPADLRPQGHDIIRTWAFYSMVQAAYHNQCAPWKNIMISGWCLAHDKTKMSKSKGNVLSPVGLLKEFGADALRYWAGNARLGADTSYDANVTREGRRLTNKIFNAGKFLSQFIGNACTEVAISGGWDLWIVKRFNDVRQIYISHMDQYEYSLALQEAENFFWKDLCDNYLECVKRRAYDGNASACGALKIVFKGVLELFAPFLPYVTDLVYGALFDGLSVHRRGSWSDVDELAVLAGRDSAESECYVKSGLELLEMNRKIRSEHRASPKKAVDIVVHSSESWDGPIASSVLADIYATMNVREAKVVHDNSLKLEVSFVD